MQVPGGLTQAKPKMQKLSEKRLWKAKFLNFVNRRRHRKIQTRRRSGSMKSSGGHSGEMRVCQNSARNIGHTRRC